MKKTVYLLAALLALGCNTLEQNPVDKLFESNAFQTEADLKLYTNGFYSMLPSAYTIFYGDRISDYMAPIAVGKFILGSYTAQDSGNWSWGSLRNVNYFLTHYDNPDIPAEARAHYGALARLMRAVFYFDKVKRFGDVPWYDRALEYDDPDLYKARDSREFIMKKVLEDLDFACENLRSRDGGKLSDSDCSVIDRYVALALKARICLFEGTFRKYHGLTAVPAPDEWLSEAAEAAEAVMESGLFSLAKDYSSLFVSEEADKKETIIAIIHSEGLQVYHAANWYYTSPSYGECLGLTHQFINTYLNADGSRFTDKPGYDEMEFQDEVSGRDPRLAATIRCGRYIRGDGKVYAPDFGACTTGYQIRKWVSRDVSMDSRSMQTTAIPWIRYAEVLLNYAEAKAELGEFTPDDWNKTVKALRLRAGIRSAEMPSAADSYLKSVYFPDIDDPVLLEIRRERGVELVAENQRFDDIRRWKRGELMTMEYQGIYVPSLDLPLDLNGDGDEDVTFVKKTSWQSNTYQVMIGSKYLLSGKNYGRLIYKANTNEQYDRLWEDKMYLYPVPYDAIVVNPALGQNPGWEM